VMKFTDDFTCGGRQHLAGRGSRSDGQALL
jgi:hypothetical protein